MKSVHINWDRASLHTHTHTAVTLTASLTTAMSYKGHLICYRLRYTLHTLTHHSSHRIFLTHTQLHTWHSYKHPHTHTRSRANSQHPDALLRPGIYSHTHTHTHSHSHAASPLKQPVTPNSTVGPDGGLDGTDRARQQSGRYGFLKTEWTHSLCEKFEFWSMC